jgi:hypothetical protein
MYIRFVIAVSLLSCTSNIAGQETAVQQSVTAALVSLTKEADEEVRLAAFHALKDLPRSEEVEDAFRRALDDENADVRLLALSDALNRQGPTDDVLDRLVRAIEDEKLSNFAYNSLIAIGEPAIPRLIGQIEDSNMKVMGSATSILGSAYLGEHRERSVACLTGLLKNKDMRPDIRVNAIGSLRSIATADPDKDHPFLRVFAAMLVRRYDANSDGVLSEQEWSLDDNSKKYAGADKDGDGRITAEEIARFSVARTRKLLSQ